MSEFHFKCSNCNATISADDEMIGQTGPCPGCGETVTVNKPVRVTPISSESQRATEQNDGDSTNNKIFHRSLLALLVLLNILFAVSLFWQIDQAQQLKLLKKNEEENKIIDCTVRHFDREEYSSGLKKSVDLMIELGYEPVGQLCNDGINGAYYLFIKRGRAK